MLPQAAPAQRQIRRRLEPFIQRAATTPGADRYRKRFPVLAHLWTLVLHVLLGSASLRQTHSLIGASMQWWQRWGMTTWISFSQLARSSSSRPLACVETVLADVVAAARRQPIRDPLWHRLQRVEAVDSTFLVLSAKLSPWSCHGQATPGVRLQSALDLAQHIPDVLRLSLADTNDYTALWERPLAARRGWTLLFDLGYYGHQQFARLRAAGVHFITRLNDQASYHITATQPVPGAPTPDGDCLLADQTITLGSPNNRRGAVVPGLRLVISRNRYGRVHCFVTDRHDLTAAEVVQLYRKRWQIELFFRWLKRQLGAIRPLGTSRAAVWLTILMVLIVAVISLLLAADRPATVSRVAWLRALGMAILVEAIPDG